MKFAYFIGGPWDQHKVVVPEFQYGVDVLPSPLTETGSVRRWPYTRACTFRSGPDEFAIYVPESLV